MPGFPSISVMGHLKTKKIHKHNKKHLFYMHLFFNKNTSSYYFYYYYWHLNKNFYLIIIFLEQKCLEKNMLFTEQVVNSIEGWKA